MKGIYLGVSLLLFVACGGSSNTTSDTESMTTSESISSTPSAKAQLGVMANAKVMLYELQEGGNQKLLAVEFTTQGEDIETIGNFDPHLEKLQEDNYYLYEVREGEDWDVDDDGVIDAQSTSNQGAFHLLAKGSSLKAIETFRVTVISEIVYHKALPFLNQPEGLEERLRGFAQEVIASDLNGDGFVGREDVLRYDPVRDRDHLTPAYQERLDEMIENILNNREVTFVLDPSSVIAPTLGNTVLSIEENQPIGTLVGKVNLLDSGDSEIFAYRLTESSDFEVDNEGNIKTLVYLDYETTQSYQLECRAINHAGESNPSMVSITIEDQYEPAPQASYPKTEAGIQQALNNGDYLYVLQELFNNRTLYSDMNDDEVNMNIAGAYVGISGYTLYDITSAIATTNDNNNSFNGFLYDVTKNNNAVKTLTMLNEADKYYTKVVGAVDCTDTDTLSEAQRNSCFDLGLIRLTSLSNGVKLLFGGEEEVVKKWSEGVDINSSEDKNGNGVIDTADASACAIVYATKPNENCQEGSSFSYRGGVVFVRSGVEYNATLIEVDVGSSTYGYETFYQLISSKSNNNTPLLTDGVCSSTFVATSGNADGRTYFPCPVIDSSGELMGLQESLEPAANIQALFPEGSQTQQTAKNYIQSITGSTTGTVGLDNLANYLQQ